MRKMPGRVVKCMFSSVLLLKSECSMEASGSQMTSGHTVTDGLNVIGRRLSSCFQWQSVYSSFHGVIFSNLCVCVLIEDAWQLF